MYNDEKDDVTELLKTENYNTLFSFSTNERIFSYRISPMGMRKRGIIINPNEGDDLIPSSNKTTQRKNTFVINVRDVNRTNN